MGGIAEEEEEEDAGTEADKMAGAQAGGMQSPPPSHQTGQPFSTPTSAGLGQRVMSSVVFKSYEAKQDKHIADIRNELNIHKGQVNDLRSELRNGFSSMGESMDKG